MATVMSYNADTPDSNDPLEYPLEAARREKMATARVLGVDPWGQRFDDRQLVRDIRALATKSSIAPKTATRFRFPTPAHRAKSSTFANGRPTRARANLSALRFALQGRVVLHRDKGKLHFVDIRDWTGKLQLMIGKKQVGDDWQVLECVDLGDIIGVDGKLVWSNTGELSISAERVHFLTKSIETPPDKHSGLQDVELRQRQRYLDLIHTDGVLDRFLQRTKIVRSIRETLGKQGFVEVEGPTLHTIAGGAAARPFETHHNALDIPLTLRIALELHLKRLMVGGIERVYELGRVYRNEGISQKHNPEFTMLEVYQAFGDYRSMMDLTEACICDAIQATGQEFKLQWGDGEVDFTPPFERKTYAELFQRTCGRRSGRRSRCGRVGQVAAYRNRWPSP